MNGRYILIAGLILTAVAACGPSIETAAPELVGPSPEEASVAMVTEPVTVTQNPGNEEGVAFIARVNGQTDIFLLSLDGSELKNLTDDNLREDYFEWTPDGSRIAYRIALSENGSFGSPFQNWIINADGSGKSLMRDCPIGCSPFFWAPDGQKTAVIVTESLTPPQVGVAIGDSNGNINQVISIYGALYEQFWWSPNSRSLAYTVINEDRSETLVVFDTHGMYQTFSATSPGHILPIGWSYDSNHLLYVDMNTAPEIYHIYSFLTGEYTKPPVGAWLEGWLADGSLYALSSDKTDVVRIPPRGEDPALLMDFFLQIEEMDITPNGSQAVVRPYLDRDRISKGEIPDTELYLLIELGYISLLEPEMLPGMTQINHIALRPASSHRAPEATRAASPEQPEVDHNKDFAFLAKVNGQNDLFLYKTDQGAAINLTNDAAIEEVFSWSADGSLIAYRIFDASFRAAQIWTIRPDGTEKRMLLDCPNGCSPAAFSPDGSLIAVLINSSIEGHLDQIDIMKPDGSDRRTIMSGLNWELPLIWSPDSRRIAAAQINPDGMRPIAVYQFDSDSVYFYLVTTTEKNLAPWSPSGDQLLFYDITARPPVSHILNLSDETDQILEINGMPDMWLQDGSLAGVDGQAIFSVLPDGSGYRVLYSFPWSIFRWDITGSGDLIFVPEGVRKGQELEEGVYRAYRGSEPVKVVGAEEIPGLEFIYQVVWRR